MKLVSIFLLNILGNFEKCAGKDSTTEKEEELEEDCTSYQFAPITKVIEYLPAMENDNYNYEVSFKVRNGCGNLVIFSRTYIVIPLKFLSKLNIQDVFVHLLCKNYPHYMNWRIVRIKV